MLRFFVAATLLTLAYGSVDKAVVILKSGEIDGKVTFTKTTTGIRIEGTINGLPPGKHGFHIHEKGDLGDNCAAAGAHLNPGKKDHGAPSDENRHVGDLGNIVSDENKVAKIDFVDNVISFEGDSCIVGRALVIHADADDLGKGGFNDSRTTGHAGARLACGVVGILEATPSGAPTHNLGGYFLLLVALFLAKMAV